MNILYLQELPFTPSIVILANSCLLLTSSGCAVSYHVLGDMILLTITAALGLLFIANQLAELSSPYALGTSTSASYPLLCVQVHASHLSLGCTLLVMYILAGEDRTS